MIDVTIIAAHGPHDVLGQATPVRWPDGSTLALHWVAIHGAISSTLRAHCHDTLHWVVVDVARLGCAAIVADIKALPRRDADGVIDYHLRRHFTGADALAAHTLQAREAAWTIPQHAAAA